MNSNNDAFPPGWLPAPIRPGFLSSFHGIHLKSWLGQGGMGMVFRAVCDEDFWEEVDDDIQDACAKFEGIQFKGRSTVAVKILKPEFQGTRIARRHFEKEARMMSRLNHPNLLPVIAMGEVGEVSYFVTPLLDSGSLAGLLDVDHLMEPGSVRDLVLQMGRALAYCHGRDVLHRDVKPSNILRDSQGVWRLCDFGLARTSFSDTFIDPQKVFPKGTAAYLSPKMARGESEHQQGDVYSLGAVLYEALVGEPPYAGLNPALILQKIQSEPPPSILDRQPKADPVLVAIAERAMARLPEERYASMQEMVTDLEHWGTPEAEGILQRPKPQRWTSKISRTSVVSKAIGGFFRNRYVRAALILALGWLGFSEFRKATEFRLEAVQEIENSDVSKWGGVRHGNWRNDDKEELFIYDNGQRLLKIYNNLGYDYDSRQFSTVPRRYDFRSLVDLNGDGQMELAFERVDEDLTVGVDFYNQHFNLIKSLTTSGAKYTDGKAEPYWNTTGFQLIENIDDDPGLEVLVTVNSGFELSPRKLVCFDLESGMEEWSYESGPWLSGVSFARDPSSGKGFVSFTGQSLNNGAVGPDGLSDDEPMLYLITGDGQLLWTQSLLPPLRSDALQCYTKSQLLDFDADGTLELVALSYKARYHEDAPGFGRVCLYSLDGSLERIYQLDSSTDGEFAVGDASPKSPGLELAVIDHDGYFHLLDSELGLIRRSQLFVVPTETSYLSAKVLAPADLNGDGSKEWSGVFCLISFESEYRSGSKEDAPNEYTFTDFTAVVFDSEGNLLVDQLFDKEWNQGGNSPLSVRLADFGATGQMRMIYPGNTLQVLELKGGVRSWVRSWPVWDMFAPLNTDSGELVKR